MSLPDGAIVDPDGLTVAKCVNAGGRDAGSSESSWGATTVTGPSNTTVLVTCTTSDGRIKLEMKFSRDTGEYDATIQTTVYNLTGGTLNSVLPTRCAGGGDFTLGYCNRRERSSSTTTASSN